MEYAVAVWNKNGVYTASLPDMPGVTVTAESSAELAARLRAAALSWMAEEQRLGRPLHAPQPMVAHQSDPTFEGCSWTMFEIEPKAER